MDKEKIKNYIKNTDIEDRLHKPLIKGKDYDITQLCQYKPEDLMEKYCVFAPIIVLIKNLQNFDDLGAFLGAYLCLGLIVLFFILIAGLFCCC